MICSNPSKISEQFDNDTILNERIELTKLGNNSLSISDWLSTVYQFSPKDFVLEVGCGNGHSLPDLMKTFPPSAKMLCTDNQIGMINSAKARMQDETRIEFELADIYQLPYQNARFDVVLSHYMFYLLSDKPLAIQEIIRVLKPNGWLGMLVFGKQARRVLFEMAHEIDSHIPVEGKCADTFHHEIAEQFLKQYFSTVETFKFTDELQIQDPDLTVNFITNHPFIIQNKSRDDFSDQFRQKINEQIELHNVFKVNADSYLFICRQ